MNYLRPLEPWDRVFESHSICVYSVFVLSCVQVEALRRADPPSKESCRLCINQETGKVAGVQQKGRTTTDGLVDIYTERILSVKWSFGFRIGKSYWPRQTLLDHKVNGLLISRVHNYAVSPGGVKWSYMIITGKGKSKVDPVLNELNIMPWKHMGGWRYSFTILDLGTRWRLVVSVKPLPLYPRYPLDRRLGGPQNRSGRCGEEQNLALPGVKRWPSNPSLYRLSCSDSFNDNIRNKGFGRKESIVAPVNVLFCNSL
jgi:hypothetical protein